MEHRTLEQVRTQNGQATERRRELYQRLEEWLAVVETTGMLRRLWVFGSFVSDKPVPGDVDIFAMFTANYDISHLPPAIHSWFDHQLCRELHGMDVFMTTEASTPEVVEFLLEGLRYDRDGNETILEVLL